MLSVPMATCIGKKIIVTKTLSRSGKKQGIQRQNRTFLNDLVVRGREKAKKLIVRLLSTNAVENYEATGPGRTRANIILFV